METLHLVIIIVIVIFFVIPGIIMIAVAIGGAPVVLGIAAATANTSSFTLMPPTQTATFSANTGPMINSGQLSLLNHINLIINNDATHHQARNIYVYPQYYNWLSACQNPLVSKAFSTPPQPISIANTITLLSLIGSFVQQNPNKLIVPYYKSLVQSIA